MAVWRYFVRYVPGGSRRMLLYGVFACAQSVLLLPVLLLIRHAVDAAIPRGDVQQLVLIGAAILLLRLAESAVSLWLRALNLRLVKTAITRLREDLLTRMYLLSRAAYAQFDRQRVHARIVQDTERLDNLGNQILSKVLPSIFSAGVLLGLLGYFNGWLLSALLAMAPLVFLIARLTGRRVKARVQVFQRAFERFSAGVSFVLRHMDLTRALSFEARETERRFAEYQDLNHAGQRMAHSFAVHGQAQAVLATLAGIVILVLGGALVATRAMTLGEFFSFWVAASWLNNYFGAVTGAIPDLITANESMRTLHRLAHDGERVEYTGRHRLRFSGRIQLEDVAFGYGAKPVLRGVTLDIGPGARLSITGPNGAGKSTILYMILGFYRPARGRLLADSVPYDDIDLRDLRRRIGVVMQQPTFFPGTIFEIIAYGSPEATPDEVRRAARLALADEFIEKLPHGYDTQVGEDALLLSGGEAQRLAIARALLPRPRLLVLDEPTNHLEISLVERLIENLAGLEERPGIVTISHDPRVLATTDRVYRLEAGALRIQTMAATGATEGVMAHG